MAYQFERDEWRCAVRALTEADRHVTADARRSALGVVGDRSDEDHPTECGEGDDD